MSWTRTKDKKTGLFSYEVRDYEGNTFETGNGFSDHRDAERAAQAAERKLHIQNMGSISPEIHAMSDDDLLAALSA